MPCVQADGVRCAIFTGDGAAAAQAAAANVGIPPEDTHWALLPEDKLAMVRFRTVWQVVHSGNLLHWTYSGTNLRMHLCRRIPLHSMRPCSCLQGTARFCPGNAVAGATDFVYDASICFRCRHTRTAPGAHSRWRTWATASTTPRCWRQLMSVSTLLPAHAIKACCNSAVVRLLFLQE